MKIIRNGDCHMKKKLWNIFIPVIQGIMVILIGISAYNAGYKTVDWRFIPMIFILNFVIVEDRKSVV